MRPRKEAWLGIIGIIITVVILLVLIPGDPLEWAQRLTQPSPSEPSPLIPDVPVAPLPQYVNPPPKGIPAKFACNYLVICGRYIVQENHPSFRPGTYIELSEWGMARMSGLTENQETCYPKTGRWRAERVQEADSKYFIHRVTLYLLGNYVRCKERFDYTCNFELGISPQGIVGTTQLVCEGGSRWILCHQPETREYMRQYCEVEKAP